MQKSRKTIELNLSLCTLLIEPPFSFSVHTIVGDLWWPIVALVKKLIK